jgi:hypothetical protein
MCYGAGGMAGHAQFGARTGGALIILGTLLLMTALFFSGSRQIKGDPVDAEATFVVWRQ